MVWFKVDDTLAFHAKVMAAGNPAMGLWVRAGAWCAQMLTDGRVPHHMVRSLGTARQAKSLVDAGLWEETDSGYAFHDWSADERQPTREQVENKREQWREKKRRQRRNAAGQFDSSPGDSLRDTSDGPPGSPTVPSRPGPSRPNTYSSNRPASPPVTHEEEPPPDPYEPEMSVNAILASAGMSQSEHRDFLVDLKGNGARNTTALVNALYRDRKLTGRIAEWRNERNLAAEATSRPKAGKRTTDDRVADGFALAEEFRAMESGNNPNVIPLRQITEGA